MTTTIGLKNPEWDLSKGRYEEIDSLPLMATPGPVLMILAGYLLFVLRIGPIFMRKREAFNLKIVLILYNGVQVAVSFYLAQRYGREILNYGLFPNECFMHKSDMREEVIIDIWIYFIAKVSELLDTIFFVIRKKDSQVTFLHLYHHSIMMIGTWAYLKYAPSEHVRFIGFFNSLVHVFMYTYYGLAAFGPHVAKYLTWKKYMTSFQLIQFVSVFVQYLATLKYSDCPPSQGIAVFFACNIIFFFVLFSNFYRQSYKTRSTRQKDSCLAGSDSAKPLTNAKVNSLKSQ